MKVKEVKLVKRNGKWIKPAKWLKAWRARITPLSHSTPTEGLDPPKTGCKAVL